MVSDNETIAVAGYGMVSPQLRAGLELDECLVYGGFAVGYHASMADERTNFIGFARAS